MWIITSHEFCSNFFLPLLVMGNFRLELSCFDLRLGVFFFSFFLVAGVFASIAVRNARMAPFPFRLWYLVHLGGGGI
jgi:hypothetical protein